MDKNEWRAYAKKQRKSLSEQDRLFQSMQLTQRIVADPRWERAKTVMLFLSFGTEWNTQELIEIAWQEEKQVALPVCLPDYVMQPFLYTPKTSLLESKLGIREIDIQTAVAIDSASIDFCIIPGLLMDPYGTRLGYGAGFYDRFLLRLSSDCTKIATGFDCQFVGNRLPAESTDYHIDEIFLPSKVVYTLPFNAYSDK